MHATWLTAGEAAHLPHLLCSNNAAVTMRTCVPAILLLLLLLGLITLAPHRAVLHKSSKGHEASAPLCRNLKTAGALSGNSILLTKAAEH